MSWDDVEAKVETMLRTACKAATDSASLSPRYRCRLADSEAPTGTLPCVDIRAATAVNDGWHTDLYQVPVLMTVMTAPIDDPTRAVLKATYRACRQAIEETAFAVTGWEHVAVTVDPGGEPDTDPPSQDYPSGVHYWHLPLTAAVALTPRT